MELYGAERLISHTFQHKIYISIECTNDFILYALVLFARKQSNIQVCVYVCACV